MAWLRPDSRVALAGPEGVQGYGRFGGIFEDVQQAKLAAETQRAADAGVTAKDVQGWITAGATVWQAANPLIQTFLPDKYQSAYQKAVNAIVPTSGGQSIQPPPQSVTTAVPAAPPAKDNTLLYVGGAALALIFFMSMKRRR